MRCNLRSRQRADVPGSREELMDLPRGTRARTDELLQMVRQMTGWQLLVHGLGVGAALLYIAFLRATGSQGSSPKLH